ncbi:PREDICTED: WD repeat-containing protein 62-like [Thamnophis sirtalis]|uniref:WD repeat-containing protein 62-like n=1 Tax=Thamnophis sirtalis TaxID=35019 RepID=A0A6I9Y2X5_9SAUR|nr:PREDICTED: WD repeat-containing protein 62-like [Thamnophis sirtalis]
MWAKRLLGEADHSESSAFHSRVSYQPQGRWAERADKEPIKTILEADLSYFTPIQNRSTAEADLAQWSLDRLVMEAENSPGNITEDFKQPDLSSSDKDTPQELESSGTNLYVSQADSSSSFGERRSVHQPLFEEEASSPRDKAPEITLSGAPLDAELPVSGHQHKEAEGGANLEENFSQNGSLPQTPEQERYLKNHFETLAGSPLEERFDGCIRDRQSLEDSEDGESPLPNPRLSISARFLSRAQKNCRFAAAFLPRVCPLAQAATAERLSEESLPLSDFTKSKKPPPEIQPELKGSLDAKTAGVSEIQGLVRSFEGCLQTLHLKFQETLQLYDKVLSCTGGTEEEFAHVQHRLSSTFCWMKSELATRDCKDKADVAVATDPSSFWPICLQEGEAHALLKHYSDSLLNVVQKKLEEARKTSLP